MGVTRIPTATPAQASLPGFEPEPERIDSLYLAILPPATAAAQIESLAKQLRGEHGLKGNPLERERLHVSLHYLGGYAGLPQAIVSAARSAAASMALPAFEIVFDRVGSVARGQRSQPLMLLGGAGMTALNQFQNALGLALRKTGLGRWATARFTPQLTLLYDDRSLEQTIEPIAWIAQEFVLVHGMVGQSRHEVIGRWPLRK